MKQNHKTKLAALFLGVTACGAIFAVASNAIASRDSARITALRQAATLQALGWSFRDEYEMGFLEEGAKEVSSTVLYEGNTYALVAGGCHEAQDVDIEVYDENWNLVGRDADSEDLAVVQITPRFTGRFYTVVRMYDSTPGGAHFVLVTGHR